MADKSSNLLYLVDFRLPLIILVSIFGVLTPLLIVIEGLSIVDGYYYTIVTMTRVGAGDIAFSTAMGSFIHLLIILGTISIVVLLVLSVMYYVRLGMHYETQLKQ